MHAKTGTTDQIIIHADGACSGNPGPGGWAATIRRGARPITLLSGGDPHTTNNIMELQATRHALSFISSRDLDLATARIVLRLDSEYVLKGMQEWLPGWKRRNWRTSGGSAVKNREIWEELDRLQSHLGALCPIDFVHVRGHSGDMENDRVDAAAVDARRRARHANGIWIDPVRALVTPGTLKDIDAGPDLPGWG